MQRKLTTHKKNWSFADSVFTINFHYQIDPIIKVQIFIDISKLFNKDLIKVNFKPIRHLQFLDFLEMH